MSKALDKCSDCRSSRQVEFVAPGPFKGPAIGLDRPLQQVQRVQGAHRFVVEMHDTHKARSSH
jgi:hypothetical protein